MSLQAQAFIVTWLCIAVFGAAAFDGACPEASRQPNPLNGPTIILQER